ncbi:MAG: transposase family protein [Chloroflexi bacterium]|nr:transposase family protein [Chloroflexota bacterium]
MRNKHPAWGGRKIHTRLKNLGQNDVPSPSTITAILHRYGCIDPEEGKKHTPFQRFEMERPNQLWQMDFKGYFRIAGQQCHPLTILDDHSRFLLGLKACQNQQGTTVRDHLTVVFRQYGMPDTFLVDNGVPWGPAYANRYYTRLNTWLFRLDIKVSHSRPYHPQTMGKDERLHRTLKAEVLKYQQFDDFPMCQRSFNIWRRVYNCERPHEALGMAVPVSRYRPSQRKFPEKLPPVTYPPQDQVRKVTHGGRISFGNRVFRVGKAFTGSHVAIRHTQIDGEYEVYFCKQMIRRLSLRDV